MKSAGDRAIDAAWEFAGKRMSRLLFLALLEDKSELGDVMRTLVSVVGRTIEEDRAAYEKARAPS